MGIEDEIKDIEEEIRKTPYNKATQKHIGMLKAKIAKLKLRKEVKSSGKKGFSYGVKKTGDATVILLGFPSVGKSTLLNRITNAESKVGGYDFTTLKIIPGALDFRGAKIQVLDIPGIIEEAAEGRGRGKEVLSVVRNADLLLIILSGGGAVKQADVIRKELYTAGLRINKRRPDVKIVRKDTGGIKVNFVKRVKKLDKETVKALLQEFKIMNGEVLVRENITDEEFIDCLVKNRVYIPALFVLNKVDKLEENKKERIRKWFKKERLHLLEISALEGINTEDLKEKVWEALGFVRIYLKQIGKEPDMEEPLIIRGRVSVRDICEGLHGDFLKHFKFAKIWGPTARFPGQKVGLDQKLKDKDIVEIHS
jgi:small GTP-binding protein